jgi:protease-4
MINSNSSSAAPHTAWERNVIEQLALGALQEQKRTRRWNIFFRMLFFIYLLGTLALFIDWPGKNEKHHGNKKSEKHTAVVELKGVIQADGDASAEKINKALRAAFEDSNTQGVILKANSPGGSPVQSSMMNDEIVRLRKQYPAIPLYVVAEEVCASGCYYVAAAADKIYVNQASIIGSIGVLMDGFGFVETMNKVGVERRLLTAGQNKGFLDPFSPVNEAHKNFTLAMLNEIHQQFIEVVKRGRGKRLQETPELFSGLFWSGAKSIQLGLADELGSVDSVAKSVIKAEDIVEFSEKENFAERFAKRFGASVGAAAFQSIKSGAQQVTLQ